MDNIHRTISNDGTGIAGRVDGQGPPLVLVHGSLEDGDLCWGAMLPHLRERFTCYLLSTRSRGLSDESADVAPERRLEDVVSFVNSIGEPVHLFGESDGGRLALGTAARTDAVSTVAVYEPVVFEVAHEDLDTTLQDTLPNVGDAVSQGRLGDAARVFSAMIANEDELAALTTSGYLDDAGHYMPLLLQELEEDAQSQASPTDPSVLAQVNVPVLLLQGSRSALHGWFSDGVRHVADHVVNPRLREVHGAGHFGVALEPEAIAEALIEFFADVSTTST